MPTVTVVNRADKKVGKPVYFIIYFGSPNEGRNVAYKIDKYDPKIGTTYTSEQTITGRLDPQEKAVVPILTAQLDEHLRNYEPHILVSQDPQVLKQMTSDPFLVPRPYRGLGLPRRDPYTLAVPNSVVEINYPLVKINAGQWTPSRAAGFRLISARFTNSGRLRNALPYPTHSFIYPTTFNYNLRSRLPVYNMKTLRVLQA